MRRTIEAPATSPAAIEGRTPAGLQVEGRGKARAELEPSRTNLARLEPGRPRRALEAPRKRPHQIEGLRRAGLLGPGAASTPVARSPRRADIQGLRAILMVQVLLFHAWNIGSPIGIDAFIAVSAYLMTASFLRRSEAGQMPFFVERWANTFKRLLPPLVVVVLATLGASLAILRADRWREIAVQAIASLTYWENWRLVEVSADYYADDYALSSPLQHLWSMSMQGQVFLAWPLILTCCVLLARRLGRSPRALATIAFTAIAAASLFWLLFLSPADGSVYFDTRARIWEFALGSIVAAVGPRLRVPERVARLAVLVALATLLVYCLVSIGEYPGPMAAVPILCVAVLLSFTPLVQGNAVDRLLSARPLVGMGDISYAVYLVHWPIFVLYLAVIDAPSLGFLEGVVLIAISIAVGWLLTHLIDDPLRRLPWANRSTATKGAMVVASLAVGLIPASAVYLWITARAADLEKTQDDVSQEVVYEDARENLTELIPLSGPGSDAHPGARILLGHAQAEFAGVPPIPDALTARQQPGYDGTCDPLLAEFLGRDGARFCTTLGDAETAEKTILLAGSSHTQQLVMWQIPPLIESQSWAALAALYPGCPWTSPGEYSQKCSAQNARLAAYVDQHPPDYAFLVVTQSTPDTPDEYLVPGVVEMVQQLTDRGIPVFGVSDSLRSRDNLYDCSDSRPVSKPIGGCLLSEDDHFASRDVLEPLLDIEGYHHIEMRDAYCVDGVCPTIIGNIMVYFDSNHVTTAYSRSVGPYFSQRALDAIRDYETAHSQRTVEVAGATVN